MYHIDDLVYPISVRLFEGDCHYLTALLLRIGKNSRNWLGRRGDIRADDCSRPGIRVDNSFIRLYERVDLI